MRKLFKQGSAYNVPRGAPVKLSMAYGSLASATNQYESAVRAQNTAVETEQAKRRHEETRLSNKNASILLSTI